MFMLLVIIRSILGLVVVVSGVKFRVVVSRVLCMMFFGW